jgi:hypothetical protein
MPIYFNVSEVREFLLENGIVFTLRKPRSIGVTQAVFGSYFKHTTFAIVEVKLEREHVNYMEELLPYIERSGLKDVGKWFELAKKMSGDTLNLYNVTLRDKIEEN